MKDITEIPVKPLRNKVRIRFQDCDPFGHLNNSRYLDYFMNAREDQVLEAYDFDIYKYSKTEGLGWVIAQSNIVYLKPAVLMEEVTMESQIIMVKPKMIHVEMRMLDKNGSLKCLLWVHFVHVDIRSARSVPHGDEFQAIFEKVCMPIDQASINERVQALVSGT